MADIIVDGMTRVAFVTTIANLNAPTTTELNAGTLLHDRLVPTGLEGFDPSIAEIDTTALSSKTDTKTLGRNSYSGTKLTFKKSDGTDTVYNLLKTAGTAGYLVIRDGLDAATAWASAQPVEVYPITTGRSSKTGRGEANSLLRFVVPLGITADPQTQAAVA